MRAKVLASRVGFEYAFRSVRVGFVLDGWHRVSANLFFIISNMALAGPSFVFLNSGSPYRDGDKQIAKMEEDDVSL